MFLYIYLTIPIYLCAEKGKLMKRFLYGATPGQDIHPSSFFLIDKNNKLGIFHIFVS